MWVCSYSITYEVVLPACVLLPPLMVTYGSRVYVDDSSSHMEHVT